ncbi:hypothetical protein R3P38DRAFT_3237236 [Favolaschia claudopus]|uniref:Uncharacterized protein n=1 Tax=Favolaschia claudopus TaxID=2862362 RepID=A0AAV9ZB40_9AGAR
MPTPLSSTDKPAPRTMERIYARRSAMTNHSLPAFTPQCEWTTIVSDPGSPRRTSIPNCCAPPTHRRVLPRCMSLSRLRRPPLAQQIAKPLNPYILGCVSLAAYTTFEYRRPGLNISYASISLLVVVAPHLRYTPRTCTPSATQHVDNAALDAGVFSCSRIVLLNASQTHSHVVWKTLNGDNAHKTLSLVLRRCDTARVADAPGWAPQILFWICLGLDAAQSCEAGSRAARCVT